LAAPDPLRDDALEPPRADDFAAPDPRDDDDLEPPRDDELRDPDPLDEEREPDERPPDDLLPPPDFRLSAISFLLSASPRYGRDYAMPKRPATTA
jgi:hypothetical protein